MITSNDSKHHFFLDFRFTAKTPSCASIAMMSPLPATSLPQTPSLPPQTPSRPEPPGPTPPRRTSPQPPLEPPAITCRPLPTTITTIASLHTSCHQPQRLQRPLIVIQFQPPTTTPQCQLLRQASFRRRCLRRLTTTLPILRARHPPTHPLWRPPHTALPWRPAYLGTPPPVITQPRTRRTTPGPRTPATLMSNPSTWPTGMPSSTVPPSRPTTCPQWPPWPRGQQWLGAPTTTPRCTSLRPCPPLPPPATLLSRACQTTSTCSLERQQLQPRLWPTREAEHSTQNLVPFHKDFLFKKI